MIDVRFRANTPEIIDGIKKSATFKTASRPWALAPAQPRLCLGTVAEGTDPARSWRTYLILQGLPLQAEPQKSAIRLFGLA